MQAPSLRWGYFRTLVFILCFGSESAVDYRNFILTYFEKEFHQMIFFISIFHNFEKYIYIFSQIFLDILFFFEWYDKYKLRKC